jgi:putative endonuclease
MQPRAYVYILASRRNGTLHIGSTTDLSRRVWEHKSKLMPGFTSDYASTCSSDTRLTTASSMPVTANMR